MEKTQEIFVKNLIIIRKMKGISQLALAEKADLSTGIIGEIETGHRNPTLTTITKIANALDTPVYQLFMDKENDVQTCGLSSQTKQRIIDFIISL